MHYHVSIYNCHVSAYFYGHVLENRYFKEEPTMQNCGYCQGGEFEMNPGKVYLSDEEYDAMIAKIKENL